MAQFDYESYANRKSNGGNGGQKKEFKVGFFSLKDDGDEAIVRFPYTSPKEFETVTVHRVKVGKSKDGKYDMYKSISCLKEKFYDSDDVCPICKLGDDNLKSKSKFYCRVLVYEKDESGNVVPRAKIWERPIGFADTLRTFFTEYGNLSDQVFKIKRQGAKGSKDTKYDVIFANPAIYKPEVYVKDFKDFEGYTPNGSAYLTKTKEEMEYFVTHGEFPQTKRDDVEVATTTTTTNKLEGNTNGVSVQAPTPTPSVESTPTPTTQPKKWTF